MTKFKTTFYVLSIVCAGFVTTGVLSRSADADAPTTKVDTKQEKTVLNFKMASLAGEEVDLSDYRGKVVLMVNTASKCGFTPQYAGLEEMYKKYGSQGLVVLGFPSNDFGAQEPGSAEEISTFCTKNYGVTFPMFSKIKVKGEGKAPLYEYLTSPETDPQFSGEVGWNFEKFLIGRDGKIINRFKSNVPPMHAKLIEPLEAALAAKP